MFEPVRMLSNEICCFWKISQKLHVGERTANPDLVAEALYDLELFQIYTDNNRLRARCAAIIHRRKPLQIVALAD